VSQFRVAPWPTSLKVVSALGTAVLVGVGYAAFEQVPHGTRAPFAESFGILVALVFPAILIGAALSVVTRYDLDGHTLRVQRLLWATTVPLTGLGQAFHDPCAMKGSLRLFGNGGLYSITGLYQNKLLGRFRAFVTDPRRAVALVLPGRTVVISPADPAAFLERLRAEFPALREPTPAPSPERSVSLCGRPRP